MGSELRVVALRQTSPGRVSVELSDGSEIKSTLNVVTDLRLFPGKEVDEETLRAVRSASTLAKTRSRALDLLSRRSMSCKELFDKLVQKGEDEQAAAAAVQWLLENRLLDDAEYASSVVRHYAGKGYGAGRVRSELSRRGIPREFWDDALEQMPKGDEKLLKLIASRLSDPSDRDQVRKVSAALFRRGYSWDEIRTALRRFEVEAEDE